MAQRTLGLILAVSACIAGCGKRPQPLPPTYPVHGAVTYKNGKLLTGGLVQFQSQAEPSVTTTATIRSDGTYRLTTVRDGLRAEGAVAGPNRVLVIPSAGNNTSPPNPDRPILPRAAPTTYPAPYNVKPGDNEFNLVIEPPRASR